MISDIRNTSKEVAKEFGIDVVVDKQVLFYGGFNLTDYVIDKLNTVSN